MALERESGIPAPDIAVVRLGRADAAELLEGILASAEMHAPWVTPPQTLEALEDYLDGAGESRISYGVRTGDGVLAGVININSIIRAAFQNGFLGFYALSPNEGMGYMRAGLSAVLDLAFSEHGLHRLEANVQPGNERSVRLIERIGMRFEGESPRYLCVGGEWKDHRRYAITAEEWLAGVG